jgi:hypothetical protein
MIFFDEHGAENVWFQQDGATAHTSRRSLGILRGMFPGHVVSLRSDIRCPPRSPDLIPCDFFSGATSKPRYTDVVPKLWKVLRRRCCHSVRNDPHGHGKEPGDAQSVYRQRPPIEWCTFYILKLDYVYYSRFKKLSCLVWFLLASQIGEFFLPHPVLQYNIK